MAKKSFTDDHGVNWTRIDPVQPSDSVLHTIAALLDDEHDVLIRRFDGDTWFAVIERS